MSCDGCKYEWDESKHAIKYCENCDEYIHDKFVAEGEQDITDKELLEIRLAYKEDLSPSTLANLGWEDDIS